MNVLQGIVGYSRLFFRCIILHYRTATLDRFISELWNGFVPVIPPRASQLLARIVRRGAARMPLVFGGARKPLSKTLAKSEKRRIKAEFRVAFSLDTFFWPSKRKYLGCRAETRLKNNRRGSDTI